MAKGQTIVDTCSKNVGRMNKLTSILFSLKYQNKFQIH